MITTILVILLVLWLLGAVAPFNNGQPYIGAGIPNLGYIVVVILIFFLVLHFLVPSFRSL